MSLLVRLFFVVAVALLPLVLIEVADAIEHRRETEQALDNGAMRLASVAAMEEDRVFDVARRYLGHVAQLPRIKARDPSCGNVLTQMAEPYPSVAYLALVSRAGALICGSQGAAVVAGVGERPFFRRALETGAFTIGSFASAPGTGVLQLAMPVAGGVGVIVGGFNLTHLTAMLPEKMLPPGGSLVIADSEGTILAARPASAGAPGTRVPDAERAFLHGNHVGAVEGTAPDGRRRINGYVPVEAVPGPGLFIEVGLDRDAAYAGIEAEGRLQIIALNGALALGIFMAWLCGRKFIARPAAQLAAAAQRWREGDWSARTALNDPDSEFGRLSAAFDAMADAVSDRERRLSDALLAAASANAAKENFLSAMNHELRTPLNPIVGFAELMLGEIHGPLDAAYRAYAFDIKACGEHLVKVVDSILDLSQAATGRLVLAEAEADPAMVVAGALRAVEAETERSGLLFALDAAPGLPALKCDVSKLKQMVAELLSNAIRFTPAGGRIAVEVACRSSEVSITVRDTGAGIATEHLPRVGEPFFRAHDPYVRGNEGTGLGLAIVKAMVELHGGRIVLASEIGKGTEATIVFPAWRSIFPAASEAA